MTGCLDSTAMRSGGPRPSIAPETQHSSATTAQAITLLRQTIDEGAWPYYLLNEPAFARLATDPAVQALVAPKN